MPSVSASAFGDWLRNGPTGDLWGYFLFSHGWAWLWWSVNIVAGFDAFGFPGVVFTVLGGAGPPLGGIVMSRVTYGRTGVRDLRNRLTDVRRIPPRWLAVVVLFEPAITVVSGVVATILDPGTRHLSVEELTGLAADPLGLLAYAGFVLILGPLPEEIGWRGYLLDRFQVRWSALTSGGAVGVAWAAWHAPLFVMAGYYANLDFTPNPAEFGFLIIVGSVVYTWVFDNTSRSVLAAVLYHFVGNFTGQVVERSPLADDVWTAVFVVATVVVVLWWGPTNLRREGARPRPPVGSPDRRPPTEEKPTD
ncbi:CPBP family intramembrane glutamic endopeptidase [Halorussus salinisoli]|uniref:CPBP family intramembrane glutamic endopeptidase n=1 Tax=Halorussus salinisoli TaxID=2558242 RepID=UPI0010C1C0E0|nr:CPBP family intramembrane glutamic endopeptidase [Halorussus salinisoli]